MDCIIPGPSIRPFCAAIGCLSRIGKELYIDFDPIDGLSIRSLNDPKSVFGSFHFEPGFFERCTSVPVTDNTEPRRRKRTIHEATTTKTKASSSSATASPADHGGNRNANKNNNNKSNNNKNNEDRWTVRIAMKALAAVVRQRRDVLHLRITTVGDHLAFGFDVQKGSGSVLRVTHTVGYSAAQGVAAVTATDGASELVVRPGVLATMLEPLRRSVEIALLVNEPHRLVSSVSFAHDDLPEAATSGLARGQRGASLKTETSVGYDDLEDVHYVGRAAGDGDDNNAEAPDDLREQVVLVFTLKEFKAFLMYCSQALVDRELRVSIQFFWGGKPMVARTEGEHFSAELVMSTLHHKLLGSIRTVATGSTDAPGA